MCASGRGCACEECAASVLPMDTLLAELERLRVLRDLHVAPIPAVTGTVLPTVHTNLSFLDAKGAFVTAQDKDIFKSRRLLSHFGKL